MFKYFRDTANVDEPLDVVILDEAHRIRSISTSRFTPAKARTARPRSTTSSTPAACRSSSSTTCRSCAQARSAAPTDPRNRRRALARGARVRARGAVPLERLRLVHQVDRQHARDDRTPQVLWPADDEFDFRVVGSVKELDRLIRERAGEGATARLVAGFCWPWSDPDAAGELEPDVRVGDWSMPWNARPRPDAWRPGSRSPTSGRATRGGSSRSAASTPRRASSSTTSASSSAPISFTGRSMGDGSASATSPTTASCVAAPPSSSSPTSSRAPTASS